jgi:hypothetical protein
MALWHSGMIRKSVKRFSEKNMPHKKRRAGSGNPPISAALQKRNRG